MKLTYDNSSFFTTKYREITSAHPAGGSRASGALAFFHIVQIMLSNSSTNLEQMIWKFNLKTKESIKIMYQQHSLEVFQRYFKKDTKAWFSPIRLIYSHSLLHSIISNLQVNAIKIWSFAFFPQFFHFSKPSWQALIPQFFVLQISDFLNPFASCGTKGHAYLNKPTSKSFRFV